MDKEQISPCTIIYSPKLSLWLAFALNAEKAYKISNEGGIGYSLQYEIFMFNKSVIGSGKTPQLAYDNLYELLVENY
jgi:hypothetical protein